MNSPPADAVNPTKGKGHIRNVSADERRRASMPRHSARGPLDTLDPLAAAATLSEKDEAVIADVRASSPNPTQDTPEISAGDFGPPIKDLSYLLRPEIYHPLSLMDTPAAFRAPSLQPDPSMSLESLLRTGHFHAAAILSAQLLTSLAPLTTPPSRIFSLFYTRLVTLLLINQTQLAAQECKALEDLTSAFYRDAITNKHIVLWELRVLAVRLHAMGWGDSRRGIEGYYDLGRECRMEIAKAMRDGRQQEASLWRQRLAELGDRVADGLVELGDLQAAARYVESQRGGEGKDETAINNQLALLYLRMGQVNAARRCHGVP